MKRLLLFTVCLLSIALVAGPAAGQKKKKKKKKAAKAPAAEVVAEPETAAAAVPLPPASAIENTLDACQDGIDNDADGHVDCGDQDCEIYSMCVKAPVAPSPPPPPPAPAPATATTLVGPERGRLCRDGIDNNDDGLIDCYEKSCQQSWHCRKKIYYVPEPEDKAPGLFISAGFGVALPNWRTPSAEVESPRYHSTIPYSPDVGGIVDLQLGYLATPWLGFGVNFKAGGTGATNRPDSFDYSSTVAYKYEAGKGFAHGGLFARFQYIFDRFVPYIQIGGGFTYAKYIWAVYHPNEDWNDIDARDESELHYPRDRISHSTKHWTFAVEPGFDFYLRKRSIAIGMRAWLPFAATSDAKTDNTGLMISLTFTPTWREDPEIKPEYQNPLGLEEGQEEPEAPAEPPPEPPAAEELEDPFAAEPGPTLTVTEAQPIEEAPEPAPAE
jgi:opacity protein-like surface antigen